MRHGQQMAANTGQPPQPTSKALLLCDDTIIEAGTSKISLIGVFRRFVLTHIPGTTRPFYAFIQLTNAQGTYDVVIEVRDLSADEAIAEASGPGIEIESQLHVCNIILPVPRLLIEHAGHYEFIIFANNSEVDRQRFEAIESQEDLEDQQDDDQHS